jgi:serine/threonine protein kinase
MLIISVLGGIIYLKNKNVLHRDLKPKNILLDSRGRAKICDFGLAIQVGPNERLYDGCGTLNYRAPETLDSQGYGIAVDIWSVNVIM